MNTKTTKFLKSAGFVLLAIFVLWFLGASELVDYKQFGRAFVSNPQTIAMIVILQCIVLAFFSMRFWLILKLFRLTPTFKAVLSANCVSSAIGQWMPAALAVQETIRLGLMFGTEKANKNDKPISKSTLFMASIHDRIVGFTCILVLGSMASVFLLMRLSPGDSQSTLSHESVLFLGGLSLLLAMILIAAPYVLNSRIGKALLSAVMGLRPSFFQKIKAEQLSKEWSTYGRIHKNLPVFALSLLALLVGPLTLVLSSHALGGNIDFGVALLVSPVLAIVTLLPISFGGIGGAQFAAAGLFVFLGLDPQVAASASLLQATLSLLCTTLMGLAFLPTSYLQVRSLLKTKRQAL
ncbi:flippase-like domain-containing protein [bacterium]|nr:flippase-like domain-containing protein [bacterium]